MRQVRQEAIVRYISETFAGVDAVEPLNGDVFFFHDEEEHMDPGRRMPFATIVNSDDYDDASDLARPGVWRLNIGVGRETYRTLFGDPPRPAKDWGVIDTGHDYKRIDTLLPHPVYAPMGWVCVLNPGDAMFETLKPLLREAYEVAAKRHSPRG